MLKNIEYYTYKRTWKSYKTVLFLAVNQIICSICTILVAVEALGLADAAVV